MSAPTLSPPMGTAALEACAAELVALARDLGARGFTPATSGNFSRRLDARHVLITRSGRDKAALREDDLMVVDLDGTALEAGARPSAETPLHLQIYRRFADVGCVLHTHSPAQTVASRLFAGSGFVRLEGWELLKALEGIDTHAVTVDVPIVGNDQDMEALAARVAPHLDSGVCPGYLIAGHGLYAWGRDGAAAHRHLEALDFLLARTLDMRRLR